MRLSVPLNSREAKEQKYAAFRASCISCGAQCPFAYYLLVIFFLSRVAECVECKMPAENLAKVFGPTVVGYSSAEIEPMQMFAETTKQHKVLLVLFSYLFSSRLKAFNL